jgi:hypothetical protein
VGDPISISPPVAADDSAAPSSDVYAAPAHADRALLVVHGAGTHAPITSLDKILNPTLSRLRHQGNLVSAQSFATGDPRQPGGTYQGILVEYVYESARCSQDDEERDATPPLTPGEFIKSVDRPQRLLVLEGRWDTSFVDPNRREVSTWAGHHVGRMMFELFLYHLRSPLDVLSAAAIWLAFGYAVFINDSDRAVFGALVAVGCVVFATSLIEAVSSWWDHGKVESLSCRHEDRTQATSGSPNFLLWGIAPAIALSVYQLQRAFVLVVAFAATLFLPLLAPVVRTLATIPGLNWLSRGAISLIETACLSGAPTDVASISNNPVASAAIQTRLRGALAEIEARLKPGSTIVVLAHSAAAPLSYWLLSEPGIHQRQDPEKPFSYRLITVGGALNWAKRGMECEATPLDRPLVNSERAVEQRTYWMDCYSTWDPTPHGGVRRREYEGTWQAWSAAAKPETGWAEPRFKSVAKFFNMLRHNWWSSKYDDRTKADPPRPDPTMLVRNLGSPISAEHSEYFRNQQEFVPALVRAVDEKIDWAQKETEPARKRQWENARIALLSCLVRARMAMFVVPVAAFVSAISAEEYLITSCAEYRSDAASKLLVKIGEGMEWLFAHVPFFGDQTDAVCDNVVFEQLALAVVIALIAFALVDVYTNFCWASLGRSREPLDEGVKRTGRNSRWSWLFAPSQSFFLSVRKWRVILVWVPTAVPPFLFLFVFPVDEYTWTWMLLVMTNACMIPFELLWYSRCLRAGPEALVAYGRSRDVVDATAESARRAADRAAARLANNTR